MKRQLKKPNGGELRGVDPSRASEREMTRALQYMVEQVSKTIRNQVLLALNKGTVEKFADAQTGNYATVFLKLNRAAERKVLKRFDNKRLKSVAAEILGKVNRRNAKQFYASVERQMGISAAELFNTEGLSATINALTLETTQWVQKLRDDTLEFYASNTLRAMSEGRSLAEVLEQFDGMVEKRKDHAKTVARTQIATYNSLVGKARAQNLGIERAVWITSRDERVRPCHQKRNGKEFDLSKGLHSTCDGKFLLPGVDFNCRCTYKYIIPDDEG